MKTLDRQNLNESLAPLMRTHFPKEFVWGSASSAFQVEGAHDVDGRVASIWDQFAQQPGAIVDGADAKVACDHYHRWPEDLDLMRGLGFDAYRFSIAWPRIFSKLGGSANTKGLDFYDRLLDGVCERGLQPWLTLYHWDLPQYLQAQGGWAARATVDAYLEFADCVSRHLGDRAKHWITHNEPWCTAMHGHYDGIHAPGVRDLKTALQACHHVLLSHGAAVRLIKNNVSNAKVGIALSLHPLHAASESAADQAALQRHDGLRNRWYLDPLHGRGYPRDIWELCAAYAPEVKAQDMQIIATPIDFLGVNYYFPETVYDAPAAHPLRTALVQNADVERTAFGWEVAPQGLADLLKRIKTDYQTAPIYITENGASYEDLVQADGSIDDSERMRFYQRHLRVLRDLIREGVDVQGYFAWTLMDNFEWAQGYRRRFGLCYVDFKTQERRLKKSAYWFQQFLKNHA